MAAAVPGCISIKGSLATDSGPSPTGWSTHHRQLVHVGERVGFSFVLARSPRSEAPIDPLGIADYCIAMAGSEMIEAELDEAGHYRFTCHMTGKRPEQVVKVTATAYRQRGQRDMMRIGGVWVRGNDPYDQADFPRAKDSLYLVVYSSRLDLPVKRPDHDLDMTAGRLEIRKNDVPPTEIYCRDRDQRGFRYTGPDEDGFYHVLYEPGADELNKRGTTPVRFSAYDTAGTPHVTEAFINTP